MSTSTLREPKIREPKHVYDWRLVIITSMLRTYPVDHPIYPRICESFWLLRNLIADSENLGEVNGGT